MDAKDTPGGARSPVIFDPRRRRLARMRSARHYGAHDFLHQRAATDIIDRLETVTRDFPRALFIGAGDMAAMLTPACGVGTLVQMDVSPERLPANGARVAGDEENSPFAPHSFDLLVSVLTLHAANDILGALIQARQVLKPDGLFLAAVFGEGTLKNVRAAFQEAEIAETGALSARIAPFAAIQDFGHALTRANFAMPVTDIDAVKVTYENPYNLIRDLRGIGETGALASRPAPLNRAIAAAALQRFSEQGGDENFTIVFLTGWAPDASQPQPLKPGSARASLKEAVKRFEE